MSEYLLKLRDWASYAVILIVLAIVLALVQRYLGVTVEVPPPPPLTVIVEEQGEYYVLPEKAPPK